jgi:hypothetical protein
MSLVGAAIESATLTPSRFRKSGWRDENSGGRHRENLDTFRFRAKTARRADGCGLAPDASPLVPATRLLRPCVGASPADRYRTSEAFYDFGLRSAALTWT